MMCCILGCDIRGYSSLKSEDQTLLTAHLAGCHIKSLAKTMLTPLAFNDTGDGFFVVFHEDAKPQFHKYVQELCQFYLSECNESISEKVKTKWLKIAFGMGNIYITPQKGIRGPGINEVARILDSCKLPIPLELDRNENKESLLFLIDKHGKKLYIKPMEVEWKIKTKDKPACFTKLERIKDIDPKDRDPNLNPFYLLKKPSIPQKFDQIDDKNWWASFNAYVQHYEIVRKMYEKEFEGNDNWDKYISPVYTTGQNNINLHERISTIASLHKSLAKGHLEFPNSIQAIYLDPDSKDAKTLKSEKQEYLRNKIIRSLSNVNDLFKSDPNLDKHVLIRFTDKPVSISIQKILDCMIVVYYCDNHLRRQGFYRFLNFFDTATERHEFCFLVDAYFEHLPESEPAASINFITQEIKGNELNKYITKFLAVQNKSGKGRIGIITKPKKKK